MLREEKGITLIALIITIIILVILAAVSINAAYNSGIVNYAVNGTGNYIEAAKREEGYIENANNLMQSVMNRVEGLPVTSYTQPYFPSADFKRVEGTYLANGLVIEDTSAEGAGNQFVWVVVPNDGSGPDYSAVPDADDAGYYTAIETALQNYASTYRDANYQDVWYDVCGIDQTGDNSYENVYHRMLSSVYTHGGFWIGRYETGYELPANSTNYRTEDNKASTENHTAVIKKDAYPYYYVTCSQAQALASGINSGNCTSSLMFGIQWDLVLKYLETKVNWDTTGGVQKADYLVWPSGVTWNPSNHGPGGTSWGNYKDAQFTIISVNAKSRVPGESWFGRDEEGFVGEKASDNYVLFSTGANEVRNSKMNIVDLAGNVSEWTLEKYTASYQDSNPCCPRGGVYFGNGWFDVPAERMSKSKGYSNSDTGFRVSLY